MDTLLSIVIRLRLRLSTRALAIIKVLEPIRLAQALLDFSSVVRSQFWDGRRTGPDFISPMSNGLTKRRSGHLAKLVLEYSKSLSKFESDNTVTARQDDELRAAAEVVGDDNSSPRARSNAVSDAVYRQIYPQAVVVLDLEEVAFQEVTPSETSRRRLESQYTTLADIDLMVVVPILLSLLVFLRTGEWSPTLQFIATDLIGALILGPGTLTLIRRTAIHPAELDPGDGCAVLMDDDLTVVIQGSQRIVEAITEGGFYLSFTEPQVEPQSRVPDEDQTQTMIPVTERWQERQLSSDVLYGILEGGCRGACEAILMRFFHLKLPFPFLREIALVVVFGRIMTKICWWGLQASVNDSLTPVSGITPLRSVSRLAGEFLGLLVVAACLASASSGTILLHGVSFFAQTSYFALFARLVLQSQNYRIRMDRFFDALDHPPVRKWPFLTRASAATFVCLVLCRDTTRPVRNIDILGVLDTLIPNQRDIWRVWKERVADRIVHEECIDFAPTLPTFPDERQERLKRLLDEAQIGYNIYVASIARKHTQKHSGAQES